VALKNRGAILGKEGGSLRALYYLRGYLERDFWKRHLQQYRKRPVYWLLQSPAKSFSVYVFHERATRDTLPLIMGTRYVTGKINQLKNRMDEVQILERAGGGQVRLVPHGHALLARARGGEMQKEQILCHSARTVDVYQG
jgi:hypothetical protein